MQPKMVINNPKNPNKYIILDCFFDMEYVEMK